MMGAESFEDPQIANIIDTLREDLHQSRLERVRAMARLEHVSAMLIEVLMVHGGILRRWDPSLYRALMGQCSTLGAVSESFKSKLQEMLEEDL